MGDDEEIVVQLIEHTVRAKYDVVVRSFASSQAAWDESERTFPDMLIVGGVMPPPCGAEIVSRLMTRKATYPILVVSGSLSADVVLGWFPGAPTSLSSKYLLVRDSLTLRSRSTS
jgi:DNA-binding NarL/FixJ family response regulator